MADDEAEMDGDIYTPDVIVKSLAMGDVVDDDEDEDGDDDGKLRGEDEVEMLHREMDEALRICRVWKFR